MNYGKLRLKRGGRKWVMNDVPAHVAIRLKQLFPRLLKWQTDEFEFPNNAVHCADLTWFLSRYPMEMAPKCKAALKGGKTQFDGDQAKMEAILRPDYLPSPLTGLRDGYSVRPYQMQAVELTLIRRSLLLGDDVGLGKTYTAAALILNMETRPAAIVVQPHLQQQWAEKLTEFTTLTVHCIKGTKPYDLPKADAYIFKYSQLLGWIDTFSDGFFKAAVFDEVQEVRTGDASGKGKAAQKLAQHAEYRLG